jgi:hypothetical protein
MPPREVTTLLAIVVACEQPALYPRSVGCNYWPFHYASQQVVDAPILGRQSAGRLWSLNSLISEKTMSHVSPWLGHVLKQHISGARPPSDLVQRFAQQFTYGDTMTSAKMVHDIAADAFRDAIDIRFIIETLEAGNDPQAFQAVNRSHTAQVAECVYRALWTRLLIIVSRAYAKSRDGDLHVQHAFDLLKDATVRGAVESDGNAALLAEAILLWSKCRGDHRLNQVLAFRDKQIAHWGELDQRPPIINDIFAVSRATTAAFEKLAQGCGVVTLNVDSQLMGYPEAAARFWTR